MAAPIRHGHHTVNSVLKSFQRVYTDPSPTEPLNEKEMIYFNRIVNSREISTWTEHDIAIATMLAMTHNQYHECMEQVKAQGKILKTDKGTPVVNPIFTISNTLNNTIRGTSSTLGLTASKSGVAGPDQVGRNREDAKNRKLQEVAEQDDLLA